MKPIFPSARCGREETENKLNHQAIMLLQISIDVLETYDFIEFKCESNQKGERATGRITTAGRYTY